VLANDNGDPLTVTAVNGSSDNVGIQITLASGALLTVNADGSFAYDPNGQFGPRGRRQRHDSFTYTISDGQGGSDTATVTLTVTGVAPPNQPPQVETLAGSVGEDGPVFADRSSERCERPGRGRCAVGAECRRGDHHRRRS
jgi:large repetitive protein